MADMEFVLEAWISRAPHADLEIAPVAEMPLGATGVAIDVTYCGICRSDLHTWHAGSNIRKADVVAMGHEIIGRVQAKGPQTHGIEIGDVVLVFPWFGCGQCPPCVDGHDNMCRQPSRSLGFGNHGGFAERVTVPDARYVIPLGALDPVEAAPLTCAGLTARAAIRKIEPVGGEMRIAVIGAGGVGLTTLSVMRALGIDAEIMSIDCDGDREQAALAAGADRFHVVTGAENLDALLNEVGGKIDKVLDFVGSASTVQLAVGLLEKGGTLILAGLQGGELKLPIREIALRAISICGTMTGTLQDLREVVSLARDGRLRQVPRVVFPRARINDAIRRLDDGQVQGRLVLEAGGSGDAGAGRILP